MDAFAELPAIACAFAHATAERCRETAGWALRAFVAVCDRIPPLVAVFGILLLIGLGMFFRAIREGARYGEPIAARLAIGGAMAGAAAAALRPYLLAL